MLLLRREEKDAHREDPVWDGPVRDPPCRDMRVNDPPEPPVNDPGPMKDPPVKEGLSL
jgi:hypothetical protein